MQKSVLACDFCEKPHYEVGHIINATTVAICNECVAICNEILDDAAKRADNQITDKEK